MIESKYEKLSENTVAEYRRHVNPFFFFRLKTKVYKYSETKRNYYYLPWPISLYRKLPEGEFDIYKKWSIGEDEVIDSELIKRLNLERERDTDNVYKIGVA